MVLGCPAYLSKPTVPLYVPGEAARARLVFREPVKVFASPNNPGAAAMAARLKAAMSGQISVTDVAPAWEASATQSSRLDSCSKRWQMGGSASHGRARLAPRGTGVVSRSLS